jgi:O-antigen ligase
MLLFWLCAVTLVGCLLLGGSTRSGFLSDALLQLLAIALLLASLWRFIEFRPSKQMRRAIVFCLAIVLVPLLQLVPLPPQIWTALPNREALATSFGLLERDLPWMPISVSPHATWLSAVSLLPAIAIFLGTLLQGYRERQWLSLVVLAAGIVSVFVGLGQVAQGPASSLRIFEYTNDTEAVGFFANRNHFAALLYALTLVAAAWAVVVALAAQPGWHRGSYKIVTLIASFTVLVILVAAQAMARSRAGLGLTMVALFGAFMLAFLGRPGASTTTSMTSSTATRLLAAAIVLAVVFVAQFALYRIMERFAVDPLEDGRVVIARVTVEAAKAYLPFGSGVGTFVHVYPSFEKPQDTMAGIYANRAHNDFLEVALETGVVGPILMATFLAWLVLRSVQVWPRQDPEIPETNQLLARAATMVVGLLVAHSVLDYPLRTGAMMAVIALACALLIEPASSPRSEVTVTARGARDAQRPVVPKNVAPAANFPASQPSATVRQSPDLSARAPKPRERWGNDVAWPEEWRKPGKQDSSPGKPPGPDKKQRS